MGKALVEQALVERAGPACRAFIVGDDMQGLYGWAGSEPDVLSLLFSEFKCSQFSLPVCRRCPASHIAKANEVIGAAAKYGGRAEEMVAMADAVPGRIVEDASFASVPLVCTTLAAPLSSQSSETAAAAATPDLTTAILARKNAPLVGLLYALASRGMACSMLGKAPLAKKLKKLLDKLRKGKQSLGESCHTLDDVELSLDAHVRREEPKQNSNDPEYALTDLAECIRALISQIKARRARGGEPSATEAAEEVDGLVKECDNAFGKAVATGLPPDKRGAGGRVTLATVHKAKGLEWTRVYLLQPGDLPLKSALEYGEMWEAKQELNVQYGGGHSDFGARRGGLRTAGTFTIGTWRTPAPSASSSCSATLPPRKAGAMPSRSSSARAARRRGFPRSRSRMRERGRTRRDGGGTIMRGPPAQAPPPPAGARAAAKTSWGP